MQDKQIPNVLYEMRPVMDDPQFEGFCLLPATSILGRDSLDDDITPGYGVTAKEPNWTQPLLGNKWIPPKVTGKVSSINDYPCLDMMYPVFSQRAVLSLREFLEPSGELLPLATDTKVKYLFHNITSISDALNMSASRFIPFSDNPLQAVDIEHFEFFKDRLIGKNIFRILQMPLIVIVSSFFAQAACDAGLRGFSFHKLWPLRAETNWRMLECWQLT